MAPDDLAEGGLVTVTRQTRKLRVGRLFKLLRQCRCPSLSVERAADSSI
jgi:hypothetical protein